MSRFRGNEAGSVAIVFALLTTIMFGAVALAVDMARGQNLSARLSNALDAAALAGAKALDRGDADAEVQATVKAFFDVQMANQSIHNVTMTPLTVVIDHNTGSVSASADASMGTTFAAIIGRNVVQMQRTSSVTYKARDVELAMALDITGSMADGSKLADLRSASKDVLDTLFAEAKTETSVRVAVVPWAASVNAGSLASSVSGGASSDSCVIERQNGQINDSYPSSSARLRAVSAPYGYYSCPANAVMPLAGKSQNLSIRAVLDSFVPNGGTAGHLGMSWAWYMLSPSWASLLPAASKPGSYSVNETVKAVLLMSDGQFNLSYLSGASTDIALMTDQSYQQFQGICAGMKQNRITVFTVGFGDPDPRAQSEMAACASSAAHNYQAVTGADLKTAFKKIAVQLKQMRLTR